MLLCWCPSGGLSKLLSASGASLRVDLRSLAELESWPKRLTVIYRAYRPRVPDDWRPMSWGIVNNPRSFPFCMLRAPSCALPCLVHHR
jgi:hypothetical protein